MAWTLLHEIRRKAFHMTIIFVLIFYSIIEKTFSKQIALISLVFLLLILLIIEYIRLELNIELPIVKQLIRAKEATRMSAAIYFLTATIICLAVFDFRIALAALLMTALGDMSAAIIGTKFGETLIFKNKTLVGCLTELVVNLVVGIFLITNIYTIIGMALTATIVETFLSELEDNLFVPLFSGFVGEIITLFL